MNARHESGFATAPKGLGPKKGPAPLLHEMLHVNGVSTKRNDPRIIRGRPVAQVSEKARIIPANVRHDQMMQLKRSTKLKKNEEISNIIQNYYEETKQFESPPADKRKEEALDQLKVANKEVDKASVQLKEISSMIRSKRKKLSKTSVVSSAKSNETFESHFEKARKREPSRIAHSCFNELSDHLEYQKFLDNMKADYDEQKLTSVKKTSATRVRPRKPLKKPISMLEDVGGKLEQVRNKYFASKPKTPLKKDMFSLKSTDWRESSQRIDSSEDELVDETKCLYKNPGYPSSTHLKQAHRTISNSKKLLNGAQLSEDVRKIMSNLGVEEPKDVKKQTSKNVDTADLKEKGSSITKSAFLLKKLKIMSDDLDRIKKEPADSMVFRRDDVEALRNKLLVELDYGKPI